MHSFFFDMFWTKRRGNVWSSINRAALERGLKREDILAVVHIIVPPFFRGDCCVIKTGSMSSDFSVAKVLNFMSGRGCANVSGAVDTSDLKDLGEVFPYVDADNSKYLLDFISAVYVSKGWSKKYDYAGIELAWAVARRLPDNDDGDAIRVQFFCKDTGDPDFFHPSRKARDANDYFYDLKSSFDRGGTIDKAAKVTELEAELKMARAKIKELEAQPRTSIDIPEVVGALPRLVIQYGLEGKTRKEILDVLLSEKYSRYSRKGNNSKENGVSLAIAGALLSPRRVWNYTNQAQKIRDGLSLDEPDERGN